MTIAEEFDKHWLSKPGPLSTPCRIWQRAIGNHGYGVLYSGKKLQTAHRFAYERVRGRTELQVLHKCDVRACVNEQHLFAGTSLDNTQDCIRKGRFRPGIHLGENNTTSKLTEKEVLTIRARVVAGETQTSVAKNFGLHKTNVQCICARKTWRHI